MIKMIVSDMDGTLLSSNKQLPSDFSEVYDLMQAANIRFVVASGRQYYTLVDEFKHLKHNIAFIAENGGVVSWDGNSMLTNSMKVQDARMLIESLSGLDGVNLVLCGKDGAYVQAGASSEFMIEMSKYYIKHTVVDDLRNVTDDVLKIAVSDFKNLEKTTLPFLMNRYSNDYQISSSSPIWLDIMPKGVNKGVAVNFLQDKLNILPEETMAFGDYLNDYEMLQAVKYSYAMQNSHPDIIKVANYMAESNDNNGVTRVVKEFLT